MKDEVINWLYNNTNAQEGAQLMQRAGASSFALRIANSNIEVNKRFIINVLCYMFDVSLKVSNIKYTETIHENKSSYRDEFPFLNSPDCPIELETLSSRKFARYHAYVDLHRKLRFCHNLKECATISRDIINNFIENRLIWDELNYYKTHKSILGKHPIFAEFANRKKMLSMNVKDLMIRKQQVENNIWRVKSELSKKDKPHLDALRKARLESYLSELEELNRLLG